MHSGLAESNVLFYPVVRFSYDLHATRRTETVVQFRSMDKKGGVTLRSEHVRNSWYMKVTEPIEITRLFLPVTHPRVLKLMAL